MSQFQNKNKSTEKSAKSINEAVELALAELNASREDVDIEVIDEGSKGFLGLGAKNAVVKVTVKNTVKKAAAPKTTPKAEVKAQTKAEVKKTAPQTNSDNSSPEAAAKAFLENLFAAMKLDVVITTSLEGDMLTVNLEGDNMGIVIGKRGDTLDSLQYLTSLVVNKNTEDYIKVTIDTENYREKRAEALIALSKRLADKVTRTGKKFTLEPMNPYERRIIHSNLQDSETVTTFSVGTEPYRKVVIAPKNPKPRYEKRDRGYAKRAPKEDAPKAQKTGSYTTTYKADFKATPHKAEYKTYEEYLAAQNGEIVPPINSIEEE